MPNGLHHQDNKMRLKLKEHSRHYYLGMAAFSLRRNDFKEVHLNMQVVERLQIEIDDLMKTIMMSNYIAPVLERMW
jgi:hypothetical protein